MDTSGGSVIKLTESQYNILIELAYRESGINLKGKHRLIETRLYQRLNRIGMMPVEDYLRLLRSNPTELASFIDAIATTHTFFFRENGSFKYLQKDTAATIWCAACSSGEEPYSVVIDCLEKGFAPWVLATDISGNMLKQAKEAVYSIEKTDKMEARLLSAYFRISGDDDRRTVHVSDRVKKHVTFNRHNLISDPMPVRRFDIIFCRNVMIYFDPPTRVTLLGKLYEVLKPNGYLIIGGAESLSFIKHPFKFIEPSVYQKI